MKNEGLRKWRRLCVKSIMFYSIAMRAASLFLLVTSLAAAQAPSQSASALLQAGEAAQQRGDHSSAIESFRSVLQLQPDMLQAHAGLVTSLVALGQVDATIEKDEQVLAVSPADEGTRINLALLLQKKGDLRAARSEFERLHASHPHDLAPAMLLGNVYVQMDRNLEAIDLLTPLEPGHEENAEFEYSLAFAQIAEGRATDGMPRMEKVAKATQSANAWLIAGAAHLHRDEFAEARADLDAAMALNPNLPGLATMAGQARFAVGEADAAMPAFQLALRNDPRDFTANLYLGIMALKGRDFEAARALLELALQLRPDYPLARLEMAKLNGMTGKEEEAVKTLEDLAKRTPDWPDPHVQLSTLYYKLHRPEDGQREREIVQRLESKQQKQGPSNN